MDAIELKFRRQRPRNLLGLTLTQVVGKWPEAHPADKIAPDASKINRWETGKSRANPELCNKLQTFYEIAARKAGNLDLKEEIAAMVATAEEGSSDIESPSASPAGTLSVTTRLATPTNVRFGLMYSPDSAVFAAVMEALPETQLSPRSIRSDEFLEVPELIYRGEIDLALYPYEALKKHPRYGGPLDVDSPFHVKPIMRLRGNALLCAAGEDWLSFGQHYISNEERHTDRRIRIHDAMAKVIKQMIERKLTMEDFCVPGTDSNRARALVKLLTIGQEGLRRLLRPAELLAGSPAMAQINEWVEALQRKDQTQTGGEAYGQFAKALAQPWGAPTRRNAVMPAGLTQRLLGEEIGAAALVDSDDLQTLAALNPREYQALFLPTNVLIWSRRNHELDAPLRELRRAWNRHVVAFRDPKYAPVGALVDRFMQMALEPPGTEMAQKTAAPSHGWRAWDNLFDKLTDEQLIEFLYWAEERDDY